jgi:hypothetical protein
MHTIKLANMALSERDRVAEWFRRFADAEGRESQRYREWALAIAEDDELLAKIIRLPVAKRQPILVLTCARVAGVPLRPYATARTDFVTLWPRIASLAKERATQTNDPRRCSPLLIALSRIRGPIALIEVGASAGLTLIPDRYSYAWTARGRRIVADPGSGPSPVTLTADVTGWGANPPTIPRIAYREGIDLNPLNVTNALDREWLEALVWPEQTDRLELVRNAADIVAEVSPVLTAGDALDQLRAAVARARKSAPKATVVVWSPAVLVYLDPARRAEFQKYCRRAKVRWISLDGRNVLAGLSAAATERGLDGEFLLTLDGEPIAEVDALGRSATILNTAGLSPDDMDLLEFERVHWGALRSKESLVRTHWGLPLVRYYQRLYAIMESVAARRYDPVLVRTFDESRDSANLRSR